jgi:hypothetical protein
MPHPLPTMRFEQFHNKKGRPQAALIQNKNRYGITPAGGCGIGPAVVAAAASFKIR